MNKDITSALPMAAMDDIPTPKEDAVSTEYLSFII